MRPPSSPQDAPDPHLFMQAPVPPLDVDGLGVVVIGTITFAVAFSPTVTTAEEPSWETLTFGSEVMMRKASVTRSAFAVPPTSRKFAGEEP